MGRRREPGERKGLSYLKDRRNWYAENDKSSRKAVRFRRAAAHRANRRRAHQDLGSAGRSPDAEAAAEVETRALAARPKAWRKLADEPLGARIETTLARRAELGMLDPDVARERIRRVRRRSGLPADPAADLPGRFDLRRSPDPHRW